MGLFSRRTKAEPAGAQRAAIADFWRWWAEPGRGLWDASRDGSVSSDQLAEQVTAAVHRIHPDLAWETSAGTTSRHVLTVTAAGIPELRSTARRWRLAGPPADETWSYSDVRLPVVGEHGSDRLQIGGRDYVVGDASAAAQVRGPAVDVTVHHPHFADLDEQARLTVAFLLLDQVLGEAAVEIWLGEIGASPVPALDPIPLTGLRSVVADLTAAHTDADGRPTYAILRGTGPSGSPVLALARIPLRPATAPQLDTYVGIAVPYADRTDTGLPGPGSLDALQALEAHVSARLGADGEVLAVQSHEGVRVLHVYVDGLTPAAEQVRVAVSGWDQGPVQIQVQRDPAWSAVAHLRG